MSNALTLKRVNWLLSICEKADKLWAEGYTTAKVLDELEKQFPPLARRTIQNYIYDKNLESKLLKRKVELETSDSTRTVNNSNPI